MSSFSVNVLFGVLANAVFWGGIGFHLLRVRGLKQQIKERDDLIAELRQAIGDSPAENDNWKRAVL